MISSKTKKQEMFRRLKARGIEEESLARVVAPVGLEIGAESPAEIAVSIMAQVIQSVKGGSKSGPAHEKREHLRESDVPS